MIATVELLDRVVAVPIGNGIRYVRRPVWGGIPRTFDVPMADRDYVLDPMLDRVFASIDRTRWYGPWTVHVTGKSAQAPDGDTYVWRVRFSCKVAR